MVKLNVRFLPELPKQHRDSVHEIDQLVFNLSPTENRLHASNLDPASYVGIELGGRLAGYGLSLPIDSFAWEAMQRGEMEEGELARDHVVSFDKSRGLYIASFAVHPNEGIYVTSRLSGLFAGTVLRSTKPVLAIAVSRSGHNGGMQLGMSATPFEGHTFDHMVQEGYQPQVFLREPFQQ